MKAIIRTAAGVTAAAVAVTTSLAAVSADNDKYSKPYTIKNVLSDYEFFVEGDFNSASHIVGAIAAGGTLSVGSFGDGQIVPSYGHVLKYNSFGDSQWVDEAHKNNTVYYGTSKSNVNGDNFIENDTYIDFSEAMEKIRKESAWIAKTGTKLDDSNYDVSTQTVTIDLTNTDSKSFTIGYDLYSKTTTASSKAVDSANNSNPKTGAAATTAAAVLLGAASVLAVSKKSENDDDNANAEKSDKDE